MTEPTRCLHNTSGFDNMMQVESNNLLDTYKRSWMLSSQESVQQWVDNLGDDDYTSTAEGKPKARLAETKAEWKALLSLPESDDLALGAEAKSFLGVGDFLPISPRLSPLLAPSETNDSCFNVDLESTQHEDEPSPPTSRVSQSRPPMPVYPSFESSDTFPSGITNVSSLLALLEPDPEDMLSSLGFCNNSSNILARVPSRFFERRSSAKGVNTQHFIDSIVEDEKESSSFITAEEESVSNILCRFRENSIDLEFDRSSCRSDGVFSVRSSSLPMIPDIQVEEVESLPGSIPWLKKLDTLPEENEALASPHGSVCFDIRPPLQRQSHVSGSAEVCSIYSDEVFDTEPQSTTRDDGDEVEDDDDDVGVHYFEDDKRVTVKRDTCLLITASQLSSDSIDVIDRRRRLSSDSSPSRKNSKDMSVRESSSPRGVMESRIVSQISDASTIVLPGNRSMDSSEVHDETMHDRTTDDMASGIRSDASRIDDERVASSPVADGTFDAVSLNLNNDSARNFVPSPNSAFEHCMSRSLSLRSDEGGGGHHSLQRDDREDPIETHATPPITMTELPTLNFVSPVRLSINADTSCASPASNSPSDRVLLSSYLRPSSHSPDADHARHVGPTLLQARRKASFSAKTCSIESSGFEDENDVIRLSPTKDTYRTTTPGMNDSCPLCGSPQSPGWGRNLSPGLVRRLSSSSNSHRGTGHGNHAADAPPPRAPAGLDDNDGGLNKSYTQYMSEQLTRIKDDLKRQESVNRLHLDERLEQMKSEVLSDVSQFVLLQFDALNDTLKAKDEEILRLRKELYEKVSTLS